MKKFILLLIISVIAISGYAQTLLNGGFENWTTGDPDNWTKGTGSFTATEENATKRTGAASCELTFTSTSNQDLNSDLITGISPSTLYTFSFWAYDNDAAGRITICYSWYQSDDTQIGSWVYSSIYTSDSGSWQEVSHSNTSPLLAAKAMIRIRMYDVSASWDGDCTVLVDDVTITGPAASPGVSDAYSSSSQVIEVIFDQDVDETTAETPGNYAMSGVTFDAATRDDVDNKIVWLHSASPIIGDATTDTLTVDNVQPDGGGSGCSGETAVFYAGSTPINVIQPNTGSFDPNYKVTIEGIISANEAYNQVWIADAAGANNGLIIFSYSFDALVDVGDEISVVGNIEEYNTLTELTNPILMTKKINREYALCGHHVNLRRSCGQYCRGFQSRRAL